MSYGPPTAGAGQPLGDVSGLALTGAAASQANGGRHDTATDYIYRAACGCLVTFLGRRRCLEWRSQHCLLHARPEVAAERAVIVRAAYHALDAALGRDAEPMTVEDYLLRVGNVNAPVPRSLLPAGPARPSDARERARGVRRSPGAGSRGSAFQGKDG